MKNTQNSFRKRRPKFAKPAGAGGQDARGGQDSRGGRDARRGGPPRGSNGGGRNGGGNKRKASQLDPNSLIKKAVLSEQKVYTPTRTFWEMPILKKLKHNIAEKGFVNPTEIQDKTMDALIEGRDLLGIANTGTGKTGAFLIPVLHRLMSAHPPFQTLILVPTRELALQVEEEFKSLTKGLGLFCTCLIGGTSVKQDISRLRRTNHFIIGTPGRVIDHMNQGNLRLKSFTTLILDEFDRMLDMGFVSDVMRVTSEMEERDQTILFSATENKSQREFISKLLHEPMEVRVSSGQSTAESVDQDIVRITNGQDKFDVLLELLRRDEFERVLLFAETKRWVSRITLKLKKSGLTADEIHGDKSQNYRKKALDKFKRGNVKVLVATDVAARGIDVDNVTHVINFELPQDMESYVHRIGRTGRAGKAGKALTLVG